MKYFLTTLIPQALYHSKQMDDGEVTNVYNRGSFGARSMVQT